MKDHLILRQKLSQVYTCDYLPYQRLNCEWACLCKIYLLRPSRSHGAIPIHFTSILTITVMAMTIPTSQIVYVSVFSRFTGDQSIRQTDESSSAS